MKHIREHNCTSHQLRNSFLEIWMEFLRLARDYELDIRDFEGLSSNVYEFGSTVDTPDTMEEWLISVCNKFRAQIRRERHEIGRAHV